MKTTTTIEIPPENFIAIQNQDGLFLLVESSGGSTHVWWGLQTQHILRTNDYRPEEPLKPDPRYYLSPAPYYLAALRPPTVARPVRVRLEATLTVLDPTA